MIATFIYFLSVALCITFTTIGVAIGQSLIGKAALDASNIQPNAKNQIIKTSLIGIALTETSAVLSLVIALLLLFSKKADFVANSISSLPALGIALAIGLAGIIVGFSSSYPAVEACFATARQPFFSNKVSNVMLVSMSFIQTPIIFGFIISLFIWFAMSQNISLFNSIKLFSSGLAIGLGGMGPAIGIALFSKKSIFAIGYNKKVYSKILSFSFISQALIETPIIFSLITAIVLIITPEPQSTLKMIACVVSALSIGIGNFGPGLASSNASSEGAIQIAKSPDTASVITQASMVAQGFIDSSAIYCWLISLLVILFT